MRVEIANRRTGGSWWRIAIFSLLSIAIVAPVIAGMIAWTLLRRWARDLPPIPDLAAWRQAAPRTSRIVAADGTLMAEIPFTDGVDVGYRDLIRAGDLPPTLVHAILAAEDVRFYEHGGFDLTAMVRAAWINWNAGRVVEGASTITQQVARNLLPDEIGRERSARRKVREALLAHEIEKRWSKDDVLEVYANLVFLGSNAYGVRAAARIFFDRSLAELDPAQCALIAGVIQAPGRLDPWKHPELAKKRRDEVLARMRRAGFLDDAALASAIASPLGLRHPHRVYGDVAPWYTERARRLVAEALPDELARGGLTIETAALPALDLDATNALRARTSALDPKDPPEAAAVVWDYRTGYVEALVGGRAWTTFEFDRAAQACRQPGSAWKPIVYGAALEHDAITEGTALRDAPVTEYDEANGVFWKPRAGHGFRGVALAADALALSLNAPAIDVLDRVGTKPVIELARRLGITTPLADVRPMALGANCVKPLELARAYAIFARDGWAAAPHLIVRVRRGDELVFDASVPEDPWLSAADRIDRMAWAVGRDPAERVSADGGQLVDARTSWIVDHMLAGVVERGTATAARRASRPAAGKTGTTNDNADAWFVGFTARALAAVWVGHETPRPLGPKDDGAHAALPLWMDLIDRAEGARPASPVLGPPPPAMTQARIDRESGLLAVPGAGGAEDLWFKRGTEPTETVGRSASVPADFGRAAHEF
ncbi:MAG TPA: transglycosylase domain-containing protein [Kofleriaceae bacterium]|nr:transglycosylase domain-containing protein [Kofleriaceae bacterium]